MLTRSDVEKALPANLKSSATQQLTDLINNIAADPLIAEQVRNNFVSYTTVMKDGKFKIEDYVHAVTYTSYKLMGYNNRDAYEKTFPNRVANLMAKGTAPKDIHAYVTAYHKGKLVNLVMEQCLVPTWVLNQDLFQKALNTQADLMLNANSEKVRCDAANSILTHLKKPEIKESAVKIDITDNSGMNELKQALQKMAETQQDLISRGVPTKEIAAQTIIEGEVKVV
jgi:hypothetical protein